MKKKLLVGILMAGSVFAFQVSVGIRIGSPPPARVLRVQPRRPGLNTSGSLATGAPLAAVIAGIRVTGPVHPTRDLIGYRLAMTASVSMNLEGDRGRREHDHRWDRDRDRDWRH
jgi:hypothetical protein